MHPCAQPMRLGAYALLLLLLLLLLSRSGSSSATTSAGSRADDPACTTTATVACLITQDGVTVEDLVVDYDALPRDKGIVIAASGVSLRNVRVIGAFEYGIQLLDVNDIVLDGVTVDGAVFALDAQGAAADDNDNNSDGGDGDGDGVVVGDDGDGDGDGVVVVVVGDDDNRDEDDIGASNIAISHCWFNGTGSVALAEYPDYQYVVTFRYTSLLTLADTTILGGAYALVLRDVGASVVLDGCTVDGVLRTTGTGEDILITGSTLTITAPLPAGQCVYIGSQQATVDGVVTTTTLRNNTLACKDATIGLYVSGYVDYTMDVSFVLDNNTLSNPGKALLSINAVTARTASVRITNNAMLVSTLSGVNVNLGDSRYAETNVTVQNNTFTGASASAAMLVTAVSYGTDASLYPRVIIAENTFIADCPRLLELNDVRDVVVRNNTFGHVSAYSGVYIDADLGSGHTIDANVFLGDGGASEQAVHMEFCDDVMMTRNVFGGGRVYVSYCQRTVVRDSVGAVTNAFVDAEYSDELTVVWNTVSQPIPAESTPAARMVSLWRSDHASIANNTFDASYSSAVYVSGSQYVTVADCTFIQARVGYLPIMLDASSSKVTITRNSITVLGATSQDSAVLVDSSSGVDFTANTLRMNADAASDDDAECESAFAVFSFSQGNGNTLRDVTISGNVIVARASYGIYAGGKSNSIDGDFLIDVSDNDLTLLADVYGDDTVGYEFDADATPDCTAFADNAVVIGDYGALNTSCGACFDDPSQCVVCAPGCCGDAAVDSDVCINAGSCQ